MPIKRVAWFLRSYRLKLVQTLFLTHGRFYNGRPIQETLNGLPLCTYTQDYHILTYIWGSRLRVGGENIFNSHATIMRSELFLFFLWVILVTLSTLHPQEGRIDKAGDTRHLSGMHVPPSLGLGDGAGKATIKNAPRSMVHVGEDVIPAGSCTLGHSDASKVNFLVLLRPNDITFRSDTSSHEIWLSNHIRTRSQEIFAGLRQLSYHRSSEEKKIEKIPF